MLVETTQSPTIEATEAPPKPSVEEIIRKRLEDERTRLMREMEVLLPTVERFEKPVERDFTRAEREHTTILFGGLTWKHEQLIRGALSGLGLMHIMQRYVPELYGSHQSSALRVLKRAVRRSPSVANSAGWAASRERSNRPSARHAEMPAASMNHSMKRGASGAKCTQRPSAHS